MDNRDHIIDQKGLRMYEKGQQIEFLDLKYLLFSGIRGNPPPLLNRKSFYSKTLNGIEGYPPPP